MRAPETARRAIRTVTTLVAAGAALMGAAATAPDTGLPRSSAQPDTSAARPSERRIYLDPQTGRISAPPPGSAVPPPAGVEPAFRTTAEDLQVEPGTTPAGGIKIDLHGRFQKDIRVRLQPDGSLATQCAPADTPEK